MNQGRVKIGGLAAEGRAYGGGRVRAPGARTLATLARPRLEAAPPRLPARPGRAADPPAAR
jgi:hypothetical protein